MKRKASSSQLRVLGAVLRSISQDQSCRQSPYRDGGKSQEADARYVSELLASHPGAGRLNEYTPLK